MRFFNEIKPKEKSEKQVTLIGEKHNDAAARQHILSNIRNGVYAQDTVIALENVRTRYFCEQVTPVDIQYHLYNNSYELTSEHGLANIVKEAYANGLYVTGIEDPALGGSYIQSDEGVKERLETVNEYAAKVIENCIAQKNDHIPEIIVLCGLAHLDVELNRLKVKGIRQYFEQSISYIATDNALNQEIPEGIIELPKPQERHSCCIM